MVNIAPNLHMLDSGQCFPFYSYTKPNASNTFNSRNSIKRVENIPGAMLAMFRNYYNDSDISKLDIFHYVYGLLHSHHYKTKYVADLKKMLPHIPMHTQFHVCLAKRVKT